MKVAVNAINKFIAKNFSNEEIDELGFFPDTEDENGYTFHAELHKQRIDFVYNYSTKKVTAIKVPTPARIYG